MSQSMQYYPFVNMYSGRKLAKLKMLLICQKYFFLQISSSCTSTTCLLYICKVFKGFTESSRGS